MRLKIVSLLICLIIALCGCSDKAEEIFETAKLEELQNADDHAMRLYQEILEKYPESEYAQKAKERLSAMKVKK